jgi:hypothetical protein
MSSTTTATKTTDGKEHLGGFPAYARGHRSAPIESRRGAYARRRAAACELLGLTPAEYDRRAAAEVDALLEQHPDLASDPSARSHAFGFVSHRTLAAARERARRVERRSALERAVARAQGEVEAAIARPRRPSARSAA